MKPQTDIDTLRGHALNCAVATELGWTQDAKHKRWWIDTEGRSRTILFDDDRRAAPSKFDPAHDIADAWTLGDEYEWFTAEGSGWVTVRAIVDVRKSIDFFASCLVADFNSKAEATATARCIVWLKARGVKQATLCCDLQNNVVMDAPAQ